MVKAEVDDRVNSVIEDVQDEQGMNKAHATAYVLRRGADTIEGWQDE